jgi:hypothetical protein
MRVFPLSLSPFYQVWHSWPLVNTSHSSHGKTNFWQRIPVMLKLTSLSKTHSMAMLKPTLQLTIHSMHFKTDFFEHDTFQPSWNRLCLWRHISGMLKLTPLTTHSRACWSSRFLLWHIPDTCWSRHGWWLHIPAMLKMTYLSTTNSIHFFHIHGVRDKLYFVIWLK